MKKKELIIVTILLASIMVWSIPTSALTYQTTTDVEFTVNPSINVSLSSNDLLISDLTPGTSSDSNIITVDVSTNAGYGYYLAATAGTSSGSTNLVNTVDSSRVFTNLSSNKASLSNFSDNTWGYSYSTDNGTSWISGNNDAATAGYNGLPLDNNDNGATGIQLASTDSYISTNSIKFKIGAKASTTQSGGTYTNTVNFYAVANPEPSLGPVACEAGKICYNVNALTQTEGTMGKQDQDNSNNAIVDGSTVTLLASNFSRQGYGFAGWSDTYDYTGNLYGPQETITTPTGTAANGLALYAIWIKSQGSFQDSTDTARACNNLTQSGPSVNKTLNSVSALTDQRDGETYAIAKLADGKCWMIENLRLADKNSDNNDIILSNTNTNNPSLPLINIYDTNAASNHLSPTSNIAYDATTAPEGWCITDSAACDDQSRIRTDNTVSRAADNPNTNSGFMYSYGHYYNWYSTTAGRGTYGFNADNNSVAGDLCPAGWRLPKGGDKTRIENNGDNEYWNLIVVALNSNVLPVNYGSRTYPSYGGATEAEPVAKLLRNYPNNYLYSGYVYSEYLNSLGGYGYYWLSTVNSGSYAYLFGLSNTLVSPGADNSFKYFGGTVRCLAQ